MAAASEVMPRFTACASLTYSMRLASSFTARFRKNRPQNFIRPSVGRSPPNAIAIAVHLWRPSSTAYLVAETDLGSGSSAGLPRSGMETDSSSRVESFGCCQSVAMPMGLRSRIE